MNNGKRKYGGPKPAKDVPMAMFSCRMPIDLRAQIVASAERDHRSANSQMIYLLRKALRGDA